MQTLPIIGVDVAKDHLVIAFAHAPAGQTIANAKAAIAQWLKTVPAGACLGVEATGRYHQTLVELAHNHGCVVYVLNPKDCQHYFAATGARAKTDRIDAQLIARFIARESGNLRPYVPLAPAHQGAIALLRRRAKLIAVKGTVRQSFAGVSGMATELKALLAKIDGLTAKIDARLAAFIAADERRAAKAKDLQTIVGVGPLISTGLLLTLSRGDFPRADSFVAYTGLDLRVKDSGQKRGQRTLTKRGHGELRRLLYTAAMAASRSKVWCPLYQHYCQRGFTRIQALVILARRIAKTAWSIYKHDGSTFDPQRLTKALT